jgi:rhamnose transport system ATP-binding protein
VIFQVADVVTVLRDGQHIRTTPRGKTTPNELIANMLRRSMYSVFPPRHTQMGDVVLLVEHASTARTFEDVSFQLRAGEVLAITGLAGSGKTELGQARLDAWPIDQGEIRRGDAAGRITPAYVRASGVGFVPEDRNEEGLLFDESVRRNQTETLIIKAPSLSAPVRVLSGGNQPKTVLAKWLAMGARIDFAVANARDRCGRES